MGELNLQQLTN
jgi:hypothetical protein